jgi:hypothetical protein
MEMLIIIPVGYCIGQLYSQNSSRNSYLKNQNLINLSKASYKFLMRTKLSNDRFIKIDSINYYKKPNEIKNLIINL